MNFSAIKKTLSVAALSMLALNGMAQDLIAKQAPSDRRMKDVHNVRLNNTVAAANLNNPASDIYSNWTTNSAFSKVEGHVPANYKVDLRGFHMPTPSRMVTSPFGQRWGRLHAGLDIKVYIGDTLRSAFDGKVRTVRYEPNGYGYYVVIRHPNGLETLYGHMSKQLVKENQIVRAGEPIGLGGNSGRSTGSHLHFETRILGQAINPALMFDFPHQDVTGDYYVIQNGNITKGSATGRAVARYTESADNSKEVAVASTKATEAETPATAAEPTPAKTTSARTATKQTKQTTKQQKPKSVAYSVKDGDTLSSIARKHGTTVEKLCKMNGIKSNAIIRKGQTIKCS